MNLFKILIITTKNLKEVYIKIIIELIYLIKDNSNEFDK